RTVLGLPIHQNARASRDRTKFLIFSALDVAGHAQADDGQNAVSSAEGLPRRAARLRLKTVPAAAAVDARRPLAGAARVAGRRLLIVPRVVAVPAPLGDVAVHVVKAPGVGLATADRVGVVARVAGVPGVGVQLLDVVDAGPARRGAGPAGVLPFRLGR